MWIQKTRCGVAHIAFSLDGRFLYTLDTGGGLTVWDVATHSGLRIPTEGFLLGNYPYGIHPLPDGRLLIRTTVFTLLDKSGELILSSNPSGLNPRAFAQIRNDGQIAFVGPTRRTILAGTLGIDSTKTVFALPKSFDPFEQFNRFDWSRDGNRLTVLFSSDQSVGLFEMMAENKPREIARITGIPRAYRLKFSPDGQTLIVFSNSPEQFSLWDVSTQSMRVTGVECSMHWGLFAFNPVYPVFAKCQKDGTLAIWSLDDGRPIRSVDFALGKHIRDVAFSPDGLTCAVGGSNKQFVVFDVDV
ncbi:MAG: WD40 repeat domain-containing protein [Planctomycetes bacterium]|nr:WD40 repeat domain-containing protein [Planctomycetota bacterium]